MTRCAWRWTCWTISQPWRARRCVELARLQGVRHNPRGEEEPGRILHEHRYPDDPHAARLGQHWDLPYYGAVDTTPQWINLLVAYCSAWATAILRSRSPTGPGAE